MGYSAVEEDLEEVGIEAESGASCGVMASCGTAVRERYLESRAAEILRPRDSISSRWVGSSLRPRASKSAVSACRESM